MEAKNLPSARGRMRRTVPIDGGDVLHARRSHDAYVLADTPRFEHQRWRPLSPPSPMTANSGSSKSKSLGRRRASQTLRGLKGRGVTLGRQRGAPHHSALGSSTGSFRAAHAVRREGRTARVA